MTKSFGTGEREICVEISVLDDQLEGETREVFAVSFSVVDADFNVEVGQLQTATVMISDVPGNTVEPELMATYMYSKTTCIKRPHRDVPKVICAVRMLIF